MDNSLRHIDGAGHTNADGRQVRGIEPGFGERILQRGKHPLDHSLSALLTIGRRARSTELPKTTVVDRTQHLRTTQVEAGVKRRFGFLGSHHSCQLHSCGPKEATC